MTYGRGCPWERRYIRAVSAGKMIQEVGTYIMEKNRRKNRVLGVLLAAVVVFQTMPFEGIAVSASEGIRGGLYEHHTEQRQTVATKRRNRGQSAAMSIPMTATGQWRKKMAASQRSWTAIMNMTNPAATGKRQREAPVPSCVRYAGTEQTKYRKIRRTIMR